MEKTFINPKISIVTVVYNSESLLERTIQSVLYQTYPNIEYIIIDGGSKDKTPAIIKKFEKKIAYWISEPDKGLYDAMNKGLMKVTGEYVCFLNSGDILFSVDILEKTFGHLTDLPDIVYGETMIVDEDGNDLGLRRLKAPENLTWKSFKDGMLVCHQSIYIKKEITSPYNLKYLIASDFDWVLNALTKANKIHNSQLVLTRFLDGGLNKKNIPRGLYERFIIMSKYYGFFSTLFRHLRIGRKFFKFLYKEKRF
jgi:glycosyltransferase involved in cell wall biosynthesis